ncbi:MAG TPA: VanW family protein [Euzebya sp.]|nr:VanW family protein [Euzebya sp.]
MRDVTTSNHHVSETENGPDASTELATEHAEGTSGPDRADGTAAQQTAPAASWLPTLSVQSDSGPRWGLWGGLVGMVVVLLLAGGYMATRLPGGTTVAGTPVDSAADAPEALAAAQSALASLDLTFITQAGNRVTMAGSQVGLAVDADASHEPLANGLPALTTWLRRIQGPQDSPLVVTPLPPEVLATVADQVSTDPVNAQVQVRRAGVDITPGEDGLQAGPGDVAAGLDQALAGITTTPPSRWPTTLEVAVAGQPQPPPVTQADIDEVTRLIDLVQQAEVTLTAETPVPPEEAEQEEGTADTDGRRDTTITLTPTELRTLVDVEADPQAPAGQRLRLAPNGDAAPSRVVALLALSRVPPVMTARIEGRSPTPGPQDDPADVSDITGDVVPGQVLAPGFEPDREATLADVIDAALDGGGEVRVTGSPDPAPAPADMGILEPISTFTTFFPAGQSRVTNIQRMADIIDGTVIQAGQSFELNDAVGRRTRENGFVAGGAIIDGELVSDIGGGVSQFATTLFNAAWFAGIDLVDWKPHSIYFSRYPAGREATVNYPNVDLEIRNDTPYAILVDTDYTASSVTVTFWSTPYWEVETISGPCACGGSFSITVDRIRTAPEAAPIQESWTTTYTVERPSTD